MLFGIGFRLNVYLLLALSPEATSGADPQNNQVNQSYPRGLGRDELFFPSIVLGVGLVEGWEKRGDPGLGEISPAVKRSSIGIGGVCVILGSQ